MLERKNLSELYLDDFYDLLVKSLTDLSELSRAYYVYTFIDLFSIFEIT